MKLQAEQVLGIVSYKFWWKSVGFESLQWANCSWCKYVFERYVRFSESRRVSNWLLRHLTCYRKHIEWILCPGLKYLSITKILKVEKKTSRMSNVVGIHQVLKFQTVWLKLKWFFWLWLTDECLNDQGGDRTSEIDCELNHHERTSIAENV